MNTRRHQGGDPRGFGKNDDAPGFEIETRNAKPDPSPLHPASSSHAQWGNPSDREPRTERACGELSECPVGLGNFPTQVRTPHIGHILLLLLLVSSGMSVSRRTASERASINGRIENER